MFWVDVVRVDEWIKTQPGKKQKYQQSEQNHHNRPCFLLHVFKEFVVKQHNIDTRKALDMPKISPAELIGTSGKLRNTMGKSSRKPYL